MALVVQKYGGTSMGSIERIKNVARRVFERKRAGDKIVVVVSAMAGETDRLIKLALEMSETPELREYDSMISTGEQVSTALLAIALQSMGAKARSLLAYQVPIYSEGGFKDARISRIETTRIRKLLEDDYIVIVAGFQGIDSEGNIMTLGRGGSDTTAVALSAALKADHCEIYTDVDGIYTTDPNICPEARKIDRISYEEVLELASLGAKVLQIRSVEIGMKYNVPIEVRSSFNDNPGTLVTKGDKEMEKLVVSGVAYDKNECKICLKGVPDKPGIASAVFQPLAQANIVVDMIVQNASKDGFTDLTFTVRKEDLARAKKIALQSAEKLKAEGVDVDDKIAKISIVGLGMRSHAGVAAKMFETLAKAGINIQMISTSEIKISCVIEDKYTELAVRELHRAFELQKRSVGKRQK